MPDTPLIRTLKRLGTIPAVGSEWMPGAWVYIIQTMG